MRPVLFSIAGFDVFSAPVFAGLAISASFVFLRTSMRRMQLSLEDFWGLIFVMIVGTIGGALLFYAVFYNGGLARNLPYLVENKRIPGGSFWGSFWTPWACAYVYCRLKKIEFKHIADYIGLSAILGLVVMRIGCLLHGCCHGIRTALPWAVAYTDPRCAASRALLGKPVHPSQIYESLGSLAIFSVIYFLLLRRGRLKPGMAFVLCVLSYSALRFSVDFVRAGDPGISWAYNITIAQSISIISVVGSIIWYRRT